MMLLHKEKGVNPKLTYCPRCGGESNELLLLGAHDKKFTCSCGEVYIGYPRGGKCVKGCGGHVAFDKEIDEYERLPATDVCDECKKEIAKHKKIVTEGGVYWKCSVCSSEGVIKKSKFADAVRRAHKIDPPGECGVDFGGSQNCPVCSKK
jgi:hypothetical protein